MASLRDTLDSCAQKFHALLPKHFLTWGVLWVIWATALWFLSEGTPPENGPEIPHLDKVLHFTYFGIGGSLFSGCWALYSPQVNLWRIRFFSWCMGALIGAIDEYHQSFFPQRTGNDPYDWCADHLGAFCGACLCLWILKRARK